MEDEKKVWKQRWMVETVFSSIKRTYRKYVCICNKISKYDKRDDFNFEQTISATTTPPRGIPNTIKISFFLSTFNFLNESSKAATKILAEDSLFLNRS
jgi:hypothetical protein